jgi:hypothetical protein
LIDVANLVMSNSSPWFFDGPSIEIDGLPFWIAFCDGFHGDVSHNQMVHGDKLILTSLMVLMGISTFTSKEFSFLLGISHYIPIKILLNPIKSPVLHHYSMMITWLSHDYPINHHVFMINFPLYSH